MQDGVNRNMMELIHAICLPGQRQFDGWMIGKARYCRYNLKVPVSYRSEQKKASSRWGVLETFAYDEEGAVCQSLEIFLLKPHRPAGTARPPAEMSHPSAGQLGECESVIRCTHGSLQEFLRCSGDANSIHRGSCAVVPGLWILNCLKDMYCPVGGGLELSIRFLEPVYTGQDICLGTLGPGPSGNRISGSIQGRTCFTLTVNHTIS